MRHLLYPEDTHENREAFLKDWIQSYCRIQDEINYGISVKTIALNFSRSYFYLEPKDLMPLLLEAGFTYAFKDNEVFINISYDSPSIKDFKIGWD